MNRAYSSAIWNHFQIAGHKRWGLQTPGFKSSQRLLSQKIRLLTFEASPLGPSSMYLIRMLTF